MMKAMGMKYGKTEGRKDLETRRLGDLDEQTVD